MSGSDSGSSDDNANADIDNVSDQENEFFEMAMFHAFMTQRIGRFVRDLRVVSVRNHRPRDQHLDAGGKVFLPPSVLHRLSYSSTGFGSPMMFKVTNQANQKYTHCGVLEFTAEEEMCYMPTWMMENLGVSDYNLVTFEKATLPVATFAKFQPLSANFLEITNPKAMLENRLRNFSCLTKGDLLAFNYNDIVYKLRVLQTLPNDAVGIIECDMNVDFAPPDEDVPGSSATSATKNWSSVKREFAAETGIGSKSNGFVPFMGSGQRLNGKPVPSTETPPEKVTSNKLSPDFEWKIGQLQFYRDTPTLEK